MSNKKVYLIGALPASLLNFRGHLIASMVGRGYSVTAMASENSKEVSEKLREIGAMYRVYPVARNGLSLIEDLATFWGLYKEFRRAKPDVIIAYTVKPVVWGGLAAAIARVPKFYAIVTGLGYAFEGVGFRRTLLQSLVKFLYRISLRHAKHVFFQNPDNLKYFVDQKIVSAQQAVLVNGSGVDLDHFSFCPVSPSNTDGNIVFLTVGRLLGDKGFREYCSAARIVKKQYPNALFRLLGPPDSSPDGIDIAEVEEWHQEGLIDYLGHTEDVRPSLEASHVFVLPSYHEGLPRSVIEAMAIGRPILTTDVPGCRETVDVTVNGFLVPKKDSSALAQKMIWFINNKELIPDMGAASRNIAVEKYDVHKVNEQILSKVLL